MKQFEREQADTQKLVLEEDRGNARCVGWTEQSFEAAAMRLVREFEELGQDGDVAGPAPSILSEWSVRSTARRGAYMVRERPFEVSIAIDQSSTFFGDETTDDETDFEECSILQDDHVNHEMVKETSTKVYLSFSIVFSQTYDIPVLYFTAQRMDGSLCSRQEIVGHLELLHHQNLTDDSWDFLSMDQHPMTGLPSYFLHPCNTKQRMESMITSQERHPAIQLLSWMSMMFVSMGLAIPANIYQHHVRRILTSN